MSDPLEDPRLFDAILSALPSGMIVTDDKGVIVLANASAKKMLARDIDDPTGMSLAKIRGELEAMMWPTDRGEVLLLPTARESEMGFDESRVLGFTSRDLRDDEGERSGTVIVLSDITDDLRRKRKAAHARRLADVGAVVATVAHEIRNPVFAITSLARLVEREPGLEQISDGPLMLSKIIEESRRISRLVDDLLGFSRDRELQLETVEVCALFSSVLEDHRNTHARADDDDGQEVPLGLQVARRAGERIEWRIDEEAVRQIFSNLIRNAIQAVRSRLGQEGAPASKNPPGVTVRLDYWDEWLEVEVEDEGVGIAEDVLPHIFDAFFTSNKRGTGLGLAVVDRLVRQHRGTVSVSSRPGEGTKFTIRFPP